MDTELGLQLTGYDVEAVFVVLVDELGGCAPYVPVGVGMDI